MTLLKKEKVIFSLFFLQSVRNTAVNEFGSEVGRRGWGSSGRKVVISISAVTPWNVY